MVWDQCYQQATSPTKTNLTCSLSSKFNEYKQIIMTVKYSENTTNDNLRINKLTVMTKQSISWTNLLLALTRVVAHKTVPVWFKLSQFKHQRITNMKLARSRSRNSKSGSCLLNGHPLPTADERDFFEECSPDVADLESYIIMTPSHW